MTSGSPQPRKPRVRRRLQIIFAHDPKRPAYTRNLSDGGLCIISDYVAKPGTELSGSIVLPDGHRDGFECTVVWARKLKGENAIQDTNTMGVEFLIPPSEAYLAYIASALEGNQPSSDHPAVIGSTPAAQPRGSDSFADSRLPSSRYSPPAPATPVASGDQRSTAPVAGARAPMAPPARAPVTAAAADDPRTRRLQEILGDATEELLYVLQDEDVASPSGEPGAQQGYLFLATAAALIEEVARRAASSRLPAGIITVASSLQLTVCPGATVQTGQELATTLHVAQIMAEGPAIRFDVWISDGQREIMVGNHVRTVRDTRASILKKRAPT
jgi:predicted thioesterase